MLNMRDIAQGVYGACQFAKLDRNAVQYFDNTPEAFWRSFQAAAVALPGYVLLQLIGFTEAPVEAGLFRILAAESASYVIGWVLFPLMMIGIPTSSTARIDIFSSWPPGTGRSFCRSISIWALLPSPAADRCPSLSPR